MAWLFAGERNVLIEADTLPRTALLSRGSIRIEFTLDPGTCRPKKLVHIGGSKEWASTFTVYLNPDRSLSIEHMEGRSRCYVRLSPIPGGAETVRATYSWDSIRRIGLMTAEALSSGMIDQAVFGRPLPISLADLATLAGARASGRADMSVISVAVADHWQRIGPGPGISGRSLVDTPLGPRKLKSLRAGDMVTSRENGDVPIRLMLRGFCPNIGLDRAIRLRAPYLGLESDLTVIGAQRVEVPAHRVSEVLDIDTALIEAAELSGYSVDPNPVSGIALSAYQILLDQHDCVRVNGLWVETAFVGGLAREPDMLATTYLDAYAPNTMPVHRARAAGVLSGYERIALLDSLAA